MGMFEVWLLGDSFNGPVQRFLCSSDLQTKKAKRQSEKQGTSIPRLQNFRWIVSV
jgi:hypothetical protein